MCFDYLETSLTVDNCIDIMKTFILYNHFLPHLQIYQFIRKNFDEIIEKDSFKDLSKQKLMQLITNLNRNRVSESSLYTAIINWVKHDQNRCAEFSLLFSILDLQNLSIDFVLNTIAAEPLVQASKDCLNAISCFLKPKHAQQRQGKATKILCLGGTDKKTLIEVYNNRFSKPPSEYPNLPSNFTIDWALRLDHFVCCTDELKLYYYLVIPSKAYRLNMKSANSRWEETTLMNERRWDFAAATWNGNLVVAGG